MNINFINRFLITTLLINIISSSHLFSQTTNITGEDEFFFKHRRQSNINLSVDMLFTQTSQHYSKLLLSPNENELFQFAFSLRGYFPFFKRFTANFHIPYFYKTGIADEDKYPNSADAFLGLSDYRKNHGFGDISVDLSCGLLTEPFRLNTRIGYTAPIGKSRFHSSYKGFLPFV